MSDKRIADVILEIEGIHCASAVVRTQSEIDFVASQFGGFKRTLAHEPVQVHFVRVALVSVLAFGEPSADGEEVVGAAAPELGIALPEIFRAVVARLYGHKLRPDVGNHDLDEIVVNGV